MFVLLYKKDDFNTNKLDPSTLNVVLSLLHEFKYVFPKDVFSGVLPISAIEHQNDLVSGVAIPNRLAYRNNLKKTKELQRQVEELTSKGYIRESMSLRVVSVLLVPKKNGFWRMCVDCQAINNIMVKNQHLIPRLYDMLDELHGSHVFIKIGLKNGYHHIRMK